MVIPLGHNLETILTQGWRMQALLFSVSISFSRAKAMQSQNMALFALTDSELHIFIINQQTDLDDFVQAWPFQLLTVSALNKCGNQYSVLVFRVQS